MCFAVYVCAFRMREDVCAAVGALSHSCAFQIAIFIVFIFVLCAEWECAMTDAPSDEDKGTWQCSLPPVY